MDNLCQELDCKVYGLEPLIVEKDKELCPKPALPVEPTCSMVIVSVTSNVNDLQYDKMYKKVCAGRHKIKVIEIFRPKVIEPVNYDHLCPPCKVL